MLRESITHHILLEGNADGFHQRGVVVCQRLIKIEIPESQLQPIYEQDQV